MECLIGERCKRQVDEVSGLGKSNMAGYEMWKKRWKTERGTDMTVELKVLKGVEEGR